MNQPAANSVSLDVDRFRRRLQELERDLVTRVGRDAETARDTSDDQADTTDQATVDELKDEYFALAQTDAAVLAQVRDALKRIDDGTYGRCVVDGGPIEPKRLESVPWTPYCLKHQQEIEQRAGLRTPSS
jgi:DnaK suppressor protein